MSIDELNDYGRVQFVEKLGAVLEHSPWVAESAWELGPFVSKEDLHEKMMRIVRLSPAKRILKLFRAHPDLAARLVAGEYSSREQRDAGLDRLEPAEVEAFMSMNRTYTDKFGFPFIMAVRGKTKDEMLSAMGMRIEQDPETEWQEALAQIDRIAGFRLDDLIDESCVEERADRHA
ncbi:OHCU decarboxylase [Paenibacillus darwinianus]|uniref:2-oxo-4-hydroxy-4-carboxy-5-ureidoimidazoline decarboxylase n=1 Tax=Paenibacillus darwinianus TaxID=1380763 RepID=A0A9W5W762_9BACL|nr:OHCU decarboxylase [Paenibacillus darwinianus]EXX87203.1 OHCU decarboxylase [Paenibacillus darwinianus]EXX88606.1 OHCU decarboxylase [Paenibacillus darwinianus]